MQNNKKNVIREIQICIFLTFLKNAFININNFYFLGRYRFLTRKNFPTIHY